MTRTALVSIDITDTEARLVDAVRLAFALDQLTTLPATLRTIAGGEVAPERLTQMAVWAWEEQARLAMSDKLVTETELDFLAQAATALEILPQLRARDTYERLLAAQRGEARAWRKRAGRPRKPATTADSDLDVAIGVSPDGTPTLRFPKAMAERTSDEIDEEPFPVAAVGESHYQEALVTAKAGRRAPCGCDVALVPEPTNEFDSNAIRVDVKGQCVGYLCRTHAVLYRRRYGDRSTSCKGELHGGEGAKRSIGIWLDVLL